MEGLQLCDFHLHQLAPDPAGDCRSVDQENGRHGRLNVQEAEGCRQKLGTYSDLLDVSTILYFLMVNTDALYRGLKLFYFIFCNYI